MAVGAPNPPCPSPYATNVWLAELTSMAAYATSMAPSPLLLPIASDPMLLSVIAVPPTVIGEVVTDDHRHTSPSAGSGSNRPGDAG